MELEIGDEAEALDAPFIGVGVSLFMREISYDLIFSSFYFVLFYELFYASNF